MAARRLTIATVAVVLGILLGLASSGAAKAAPEDRYLGGLNNLDAYCQSYGYGHASVLNGYWYCSDGGYWTNTHSNDSPGYVNDGLNLNNACHWQYPSYVDAYAVQSDPNNPFTVACYTQPVLIDIGGLNYLDAYCQSYGYDHASVLNGYWYCSYGGYYTNTHGNDQPGYRNDPLNFSSACQWQYPAYPNAFGQQRNSNNPFTWECYAYA